MSIVQPETTVTPVIQTLTEKKLAGMRMHLSLADNRTHELWRGFMPRRHEITNNIGPEVYSVQVYDPSFDFYDFTPTTRHDKWATVEVTDYHTVPAGMETLDLPGGLYLTFVYKGLPAAYAETFKYIFYTWLPASEYEVDKRPHFEVIGEKFDRNSPDSEEEIWIPVKLKA